MKNKDDKYEVTTKPNSKEIIGIVDKTSPKYVKPFDPSRPTVDDMLSVEFNVPEISIARFDNEPEYEKYLKAVMKRADKFMNQNSNFMQKIDDRIDMLLIFFEKHPEMFAENSHEISRDMIKWRLHTHMEKCREMIDRIQEIEKDLNLEMHHKW